MAKNRETIVILDFGSQYTQLILRRVRELNVFSEVLPYNVLPEEIMSHHPKGIIFSGSPASIYREDGISSDRGIYDLDVPVLGICYGFQVIVEQFGGKVELAPKREFGDTKVIVSDSDNVLFDGLEDEFGVWMNHRDSATIMPEGFKNYAYTDNCPYCVIQHESRPIYAVQYHPEVTHSPKGKVTIANFVKTICGCKGDWNMSSFIQDQVDHIKAKVGNGTVVCGLSGGVDSSVAAMLVNEAIGDKQVCIFVDNGLLRKNEAQEVLQVFREEMKLNVQFVDAEKRFLSKLAGVVEPEKKRKIIGEEFIRIFEEEAKKIGAVKYLVQGTLYPDVIESVSVRGPSSTIKSHHNVGGLPEKMDLDLVEPLRELFKDEVREVGRQLNIPEKVVGRHPFPGPGLAVRVLDAVSKERLDILREADAIYIEELRENGLYDKIWQAFAVILPVKTVGVMGDERTYENVIALRAVASTDGMTANWFNIPYEVLGKISNRIINEVDGVNRVVYDISTKPPSTIEWE